MRELVHLGKSNQPKSSLTTAEVRVDLLGEEIAAHPAGNSLAQEVSVNLEGTFLLSLMGAGTIQTMLHAQCPDCYPKAHFLLSHPTHLPVNWSGLYDSLSRVGRKGTVGEEKCWSALLILKTGWTFLLWHSCRSKLSSGV